MGMCSNPISLLKRLNIHAIMLRTVAKYFIRILVISLVQFAFTIYDPSVTAGFPVTERDKWFLMLFILFGLIMWYLGELLYTFVNKRYFHRNSLRRRNFNLAIIFLLYGVIISVAYSSLYYLIDIVILGYDYPWPGKIVPLHLGMNIGIFQPYFILLVIFAYIHYYKDLKEERILTEQLKKENIQSKYEVLKNQIDPHFFFNSLSVLSTLVYKDADLSSEYVTQLSKMYRYILDKGKNSLVRLDEELSFLESYLFLMKIRFDKSINFRLEFLESSKEKIYLPPNTLQMLAENAIKHNKFSSDKPLRITISEEGETIVVQNNFSKKKLLEGSSGIGLENIKLRYELLGGKKVEISSNEEFFTVVLPVYNSKEYESIDI